MHYQKGAGAQKERGGVKKWGRSHYRNGIGAAVETGWQAGGGGALARALAEGWPLAGGHKQVLLRAICGAWGVKCVAKGFCTARAVSVKKLGAEGGSHGWCKKKSYHFQFFRRRESAAVQLGIVREVLLTRISRALQV